MIENFHFIRPLWLLAIIPCAILIFFLRRRTSAAQSWRGIIAPHLLPHLLSGSEGQRRIAPLAILAAAMFAGIIAIAGPTWRRIPSPLADATPALVIVIKVSPSMMTEDVQPSRLARSVEKIHDLLAARRGAKAALIAYAGSAHEVMPLTADEGIIDTFAQSLDPKIMPSEGDAAAEALALADKSLADSGGGSILWITDSIAPEQASALAAWRSKSSASLTLLPPLNNGDEKSAVVQTASATNANIIELTPDNADITSIARSASRATVGEGSASSLWQESGYYLTPLLAALALPFFRRGWMLTTGAAA